MPTTRSSSRSQALNSAEGVKISTSSANVTTSETKKRKTPVTLKSRPVSPKKRRTEAEVQAFDSNATISKPILPPALAENDKHEFIPAVLTFSFEDAKSHLTKLDPRFEDLFGKMKCRPYEHLETVDPFRTLATSIIGQQISWKAARSIKHKFIRIFDPSLPEKPSDSNDTENTFFPSAHQVANTALDTIRGAGLSGRKAEYVRSLAENFADGRISVSKIMEATDEELYDMLISVKGIGKWTIDMFAIFSLRRPDILPVGDLGVQRGLLRWFLSRHSSDHSYVINPEKLLTEDAEDAEAADKAKTAILAQTPSKEMKAEQFDAVNPPDVSSVLPAPAPATPKKKHASDDESMYPIPSTPFTPSIEKTLRKKTDESEIPSLPEGITVELMKTRLLSKKKVKGAMLTPKEMEDLTESWRPYRSIGIYYMWKLAEPAFD